MQGRPKLQLLKWLEGWNCHQCWVPNWVLTQGWGDECGDAARLLGWAGSVGAAKAEQF